jgi:deoxyribodipyrimidine photo-lyase
MNISRTVRLNKNTTTETNNTCVIYVMSRDQRVQDNFALLEAQKKALELQVPLGVVFCLHHGRNGRAREHYAWMLDGLKQVEKDLAAKGIPFMLLVGKPVDSLKSILHHLKPDALFFDMNTLRGPVRLQVVIAEIAKCPMYIVDTHNIVPVWEASLKQEFAARTIRPKIQKQLEHYIEEPQALVKQTKTWPGVVKSIDDMRSLIDKELQKIPSNKQQLSFVAGEKAAHEALRTFINRGLKGYDEGRNDPANDQQSNLSPYLHYGQLSRLRAYLEVSYAVQKDRTLRKDADAFLEELNVRSSLSDNFCYYSVHYDSLEGAADWAQKTLRAHAHDKREQSYTLEQLENGETEDPAWNAAQHQLKSHGKMHGYMRMYWAKKLLEWSPAEALSDSSPKKGSCLSLYTQELSQLHGAEWAIKVAIALNDFYSIDGGDPNGYVGILWSIAGLHDRAWFGRPIFGSIRYMNYSGLQRKFDIASYIERFNG